MNKKQFLKGFDHAVETDVIRPPNVLRFERDMNRRSRWNSFMEWLGLR